MRHQHQHESANAIAPRQVSWIAALISNLDQRAQLLDHDIATEEERAQVFDPSQHAYPILARTLTARRDNLRATIAALEKRLASLQASYRV
jgi:uncharacterized protein YceH (UPF0502 family)